MFSKPYNPRPIKLTRLYEMLERSLEVEKDETMYSTTTQQWSGYTARIGMYKSMYSPCEEDSISSRPHRGGGVGRRAREGRLCVEKTVGVGTYGT